MTEPDDRALEDYLKGGGKLSRKYREASREVAPPELDDKILAQARAEVSRGRRRRGGPWLSGLALAASVLLAVNLGWNVYRAKPPVGETAEMKDVLADKGFVPNPPAPAAPAAEPPAMAPSEPAAPPPPRAQRKAEASNQAARESAPPVASGGMASLEEDARMKQASEDRIAQLQRRQEAEMAQHEEAARADRAAAAAPSAPAPAMAAAPQARGEMAPAKAKPAPLSEAEKIDRLIAYIGGLQGAKFVRNGKEYGTDEAVSHLQLKREKAGARVKTAEDFIKYCASFSSISGEAYLIRFPDGRTRTAEDVLREELERINRL